MDKFQQAKMGLTWASSQQQAKNATNDNHKREWVGLTDEETNALIQKWAGELVFEVTQALKEKNNGNN